MKFPRFLIEKRLREFLEEDAILGNPIPVPEVDVVAEIVCKDRGIIAGVEVVKILFDIINVRVLESLHDGEAVTEGDVVMILNGRAEDILLGERVALNLLSRMSGIATATSAMVGKVGGVVRISATRKTTPGFRMFEKMAVEIGGGDPHRYCMGDTVIIKDNHIGLFGSVERAVEAVRKVSFTKKVVIEVDSIEDAIKAVESGVDVVMLDNMSAEEAAKAVEALRRLGLRDKVVVEVSGGITPENVVEFVSAGVDVISSGYITHSAPALDLSLRIRKSRPLRKPQFHHR